MRVCENLWKWPYYRKERFTIESDLRGIEQETNIRRFHRVCQDTFTQSQTSKKLFHPKTYNLVNAHLTQRKYPRVTNFQKSERITTDRVWNPLKRFKGCATITNRWKSGGRSTSQMTITSVNCAPAETLSADEQDRRYRGVTDSALAWSSNQPWCQSDHKTYQPTRVNVRSIYLCRRSIHRTTRLLRVSHVNANQRLWRRSRGCMRWIHCLSSVRGLSNH